MHLWTLDVLLPLDTKPFQVQMPPKFNDQPPTTEASNKSSVVSNTPARPGRNADYYPDSAGALMEHIRGSIFNEKLIALEPKFSDVFLNKAPPLDNVRLMALEKSLDFTFSGLVDQISKASLEKAMYPPIARLLSALTLLVNVDQQDRCLSLPPDKLWMAIGIATRAPQASFSHPGHKTDIGSVPATKESIRDFIKSGKNYSWPLDWGSMGYTGEVRPRCMPMTDSNTTLDEKAQAVSYAWSCSRHQVNRGGFLAFYGCSDGVQFIWYGVSKVKISPPFKWDDFPKLFSFVYATHRKENMLEDGRLCLGFNENNCRVPSVLPWHGTDYELVTFTLDDGWRRKRFIAGACSSNGSVAVVKLIWRQYGRRLRETETCEAVHMDGLVAGVVTLLGAQDSMPIYELLPGEVKTTTTYERQILVYDMIGESLCSCGSVKTFLIAMFDLVESIFTYLFYYDDI